MLLASEGREISILDFVMMCNIEQDYISAASHHPFWSTMVDQEKLSALRRLITEGLRVQLGSEAITYIDVGHALEDVGARQNHTIFARRGCGKTLLLHDSQKKMRTDFKAIYLNCEDFKQHTFPNVLIEILSSLFAEINSHLAGWFGRKAATKRIVKDILAKLKSMHQSPDMQDEAIRHTATHENAIGGEAGPVLNAKDLEELFGTVPQDVEAVLIEPMGEED